MYLGAKRNSRHSLNKPNKLIPKNMAETRRHRVDFEARKTVKEPVDVSFTKKDGQRVSFPAHEKVKEKVDVNFLARK